MIVMMVIEEYIQNKTQNYLKERLLWTSIFNNNKNLNINRKWFMLPGERLKTKFNRKILCEVIGVRVTDK